MGLAERIREAMGRMSPADVARAAEVTPAAVTQWLDGTTKSLRAETAAKLEHATGYLASWIVTGKGPKRSTTNAVSEPAAEYRTSPTMQPILAWEHPDDLPPGEYVMIPRLDVRLSAGSGKEQVEIEFVQKQPQAFRADWIRNERLKPGKLACLNASGTSMEPTIWDGDSLVVDIGQREVIDGKVYALWYEGGERVKRLYRLPGGGLRIKSDNPQFETIELSSDDVSHVRIIGRVVHRSGRGGL
jgi:phage repressor protein C with HTH and peptisase S24 domain